MIRYSYQLSSQRRLGSYCIQKTPAFAGVTIIISIFVLYISTSFAQTNQEKLAEVQQQQSQAKQISGELQSELKALAKEQHRLKKDLVRLAKELRKTEDTLTETSARQTCLLYTSPSPRD